MRRGRGEACLSQYTLLSWLSSSVLHSQICHDDHYSPQSLGRSTGFLRGMWSAAHLHTERLVLFPRRSYSTEMHTRTHAHAHIKLAYRIWSFSVQMMTLLLGAHQHNCNLFCIVILDAQVFTLSPLTISWAMLSAGSHFEHCVSSFSERCHRFWLHVTESFYTTKLEWLSQVTLKTVFKRVKHCSVTILWQLKLIKRILKIPGHGAQSRSGLHFLICSELNTLSWNVPLRHGRTFTPPLFVAEHSGIGS